MNRIILFTSASSFYIFSSAYHIFESSLDILLEYFEGCLWKCTWVTETGSAPFLRICCFTTPSAGTAPSPESATPSPTISACSARAPPMSSPSGSASQSPGPKVLSCNHPAYDTICNYHPNHHFRRFRVFTPSRLRRLWPEGVPILLQLTRGTSLTKLTANKIWLLLSLICTTTP